MHPADDRDWRILALLLVLLSAGLYARTGLELRRVSSVDAGVFDCAATQPVARTQAGRVAAPAASRVDLNAARAEELEGIPGIGPAKAASIVDYRERNGRFLCVEDLAKVRGLSARIVERLKLYVCVMRPEKTE